jgi:hypothetical protein
MNYRGLLEPSFSDSAQRLASMSSANGMLAIDIITFA